MEDEQHIDGFMLNMKDELQSFRENWEKNNQDNPEDWPMEMSDADWIDQFMMWLQMGDEEKA